MSPARLNASWIDLRAALRLSSSWMNSRRDGTNRTICSAMRSRHAGARPIDCRKLNDATRSAAQIAPQSCFTHFFVRDA
jgi:hypothetical protein